MIFVVIIDYIYMFMILYTYVSLTIFTTKTEVFGLELSITYLIIFLKSLFRYRKQILFSKIKATLSIVYIYLFYLWYFTGTSSVTINTTEYHTSSCYNKNSSRIHSLMFAVIGLTSVSVMLYIVYFYTRMLEKRQTNTSIFT